MNSVSMRLVTLNSARRYESRSFENDRSTQIIGHLRTEANISISANDGASSSDHALMRLDRRLSRRERRIRLETTSSTRDGWAFKCDNDRTTAPNPGDVIVIIAFSSVHYSGAARLCEPMHPDDSGGSVTAAIHRRSLGRCVRNDLPPVLTA